MKFFFILILFVLSITHVFSQSVMESFTTSVGSKCENVEPLRIKKILLALVKSNSSKCLDPFSKELINDCPAISCDELYKFARNAYQVERGNVLGAR